MSNYTKNITTMLSSITPKSHIFKRYTQETRYSLDETYTDIPNIIARAGQVTSKVYAK